MQTLAETNILEKTRELCQAILDEPHYKELRGNIEKFMADAAAKSNYQQLSEKGDALHGKQQQGLPLTGEEISEYEGLREQFLGNPVSRGFLDAQQAMHQVHESVSQYVAKTFELGRIPAEEDFESGGCCSSEKSCDCN